MTKYEMIYESLQSQLDQGLITMELAEEVNDMAYEKYVTESNTSTYLSTYLDAAKKSKEYNKKVKSLKKDKKYTQAIALYKKEKIEITKAIQSLKKLDDNALEVGVVIIAKALLTWVSTFAVTLAIGVGTLKHFSGEKEKLSLSGKSTLTRLSADGATFSAVISTARDILNNATNAFIKHKNGEKVSISDFNDIRNQVIDSLKRIDAQIDKEIRVLKELAADKRR